MAFLSALTHRPFALLWSGQTVSSIGDFLYEIALAWWVLEKTGSATVMSTVLICSFTPMLVFLLIGGVAVDRLPRLRVILWSDIARGLVVGIVSLLAFTQWLEVWHVLLASFIFGGVTAFFQPAYLAIVPDLTPTRLLPSANALTSMGTQIGRIMGPALGAVMVGWGGTPLTFALNSLSFFLAALSLVPLVLSSTPPSAVTHSSPASIVTDVREGMSVVFASPWLWFTLLLMSLTNVTLAGPYSIALPFLVKEHWKADVGTLGLLYTIFPIGYVGGGILFGRMERIHKRGLTAYLAIMVAGFGMLMIGLPMPFIIIIFAALCNGTALEAFGLVWTNTMQELVPREKLGRVASIDALGSFALLPVGYAVAGWATTAFGAPLVCVLGGCITMLFSALGLLHPAIRHLD
jgi:MFS family permease